MTSKNIFYSIIALISGIFILLYLDESTLFLAALLLSVFLFKAKKTDSDKIVGVWFAMSVSPAFGVAINQVTQLSNGFLIQSLLSALFFLAFYTYKPSIIGRLYKRSKANTGLLISAIISGFAAGILSAISWQGYLNLMSL